MKAPRSAADVLALWDQHKAKCELAGVPVTHLYRFAENIGVTVNELLGAALADQDNVLVKAAKAVGASVSDDGVVTVAKKAKRAKK